MKRPRPETTRLVAPSIVPPPTSESSKHRRDPKPSPSSRRLLLVALHRRCTPPSFLATLLLTTYLSYLAWQQRWTRNFLSSSSCRDHSTSQPPSRLILTASHLRSGPEAELRLRIIAHNLKLLYQDDKQQQQQQQQKQSNHPPSTRSIVIFSHDGENNNQSSSPILQTIRQWKAGPAKGLVDQIKLVPNDPINVDVSKWMSILDDNPSTSSHTRRRRRHGHVPTENTQTMLLNDSFLLLAPPPPTLWNCHGVCGLAWTAPLHDPSRHFQSYLRVLSPCALEAFRRFVVGGDGPQRMTHVQDVIQRLEVNLSWARETRNEEVRALFEYAGGHPDEDAVQRKLVGEGYPAIKLKKFFETEDPWLRQRLGEGDGEKEGGRRVSPALDLEVYRKKNHDLNHLSDQELEEHFANYGWRENRIYSRLPLVMKGWLREELENLPGKRGEEVIAILEDYLTMLNEGIQTELG